jgi:murein DD-endopeptidase MepM/ murein hydrolase activator NlpD
MLNPLEQINTIVNAGNQTTKNQPSADALRKAAMQFEALLLQQLTASLNSTSNEDEDSLFGGDGGTDLAKKLFSEQLATTMAESGGVGLQDVILRQFGLTNTKPASTQKGLADAISAVKEIKQNLAAEKASLTAEQTSRKDVSSLIDRSVKAEPVTRSASDEIEIISTFEDEIRTEGLDESLKPLILDGKIVNSTRPRIVPNQPVTQVSIVSPTTDDTGSFSGKLEFRMPANGRISSTFGSRFHPIDKRVKFHGGLDIAVPTGSKVVASADGVVKFAGWKGGYGNVVIIEHPDGSETLYGHNSKLLVTEGQKVSGGDQISLSGSTGKSTGPHLHFEMRQNGQLVNPSKFLSNVLSNTAER